jgi:hypothetical protein
VANAQTHLLPEAGAAQELTLFAVACTPKFKQAAGAAVT